MLPTSNPPEILLGYVTYVVIGVLFSGHVVSWCVDMVIKQSICVIYNNIIDVVRDES